MKLKDKLEKVLSRDDLQIPHTKETVEAVANVLHQSQKRIAVAYARWLVNNDYTFLKLSSKGYWHKPGKAFTPEDESKLFKQFIKEYTGEAK